MFDAWTETGTRIEDRPLLSSRTRPHLWRLATSRLHLHAEPLEAAWRAAGRAPDLVVFLSKHAAQSGRPTLTVHPVGNFDEARFGGQPGQFTPAPARWMTYALRLLARARDEESYPASVAFEVTHHGPLLDAPAFFLELGSTAREWEDERGARVVAHAAWALGGGPPPEDPVVIGLGGGHYAPRFSEAALTKRVALAHMVPAHAAERAEPTPTLVDSLLRASPDAAGVYVHRNTLAGPTEDRWVSAFDARGVPCVDGRSWEPASQVFMGPP